MKILLVFEYFSPKVGGAELVLKRLAEELAARGHEVQVITSKLSPDTKDFEEVGGVHISRVTVPRVADRYFFAFLSIPKMIKEAKEHDLIHTMTWTGACVAWLAARLWRKPCVLTVLEVLGPRWSILNINCITKLLFRVFEKFLLSLPFDAYVCISQATQKDLARVRGSFDKTYVAYVGVDEQFFASHSVASEQVRKKLGINKEEFIYLYFGRPGITKGVEYLLQAVPLISKEIPNSRLVMLLAKEPRQRHRQICAQIDALKLRDRVILLDSVNRQDLPSYITSANCVVVPSLTEGFGLTAAEACALGVPVVATNVGSLPEVVSGAFVLVNPRDAQDLARGVKMIRDGEYETTPLKRFSWDDMVERYCEIYANLI
ncbi:MAG: glycosyltransferase family 4 protein [Anaerolineae bacterium]